MEKPYFKLGTHNVICDRCGVKFKSDQVKKTWDGFYVCEADWEMRHILDFIKAPRVIPAILFSRPEGTDVDVGPTYISESTGSQDTTIPTAPSGNGSTL